MEVWITGFHFFARFRIIDAYLLKVLPYLDSDKALSQVFCILRPDLDKTFQLLVKALRHYKVVNYAQLNNKQTMRQIAEAIRVVSFFSYQ